MRLTLEHLSKKRTTIIVVFISCFILGMITIGTMRLVARNSYDFINLVPIILQSIMAGSALLFITYFFLTRKLMNRKCRQINENMEVERCLEITETAWLFLNFLAAYFFISMALNGDFHYQIIDEFRKGMTAALTSVIISIASQINIKGIRGAITDLKRLYEEN